MCWPAIEELHKIFLLLAARLLNFQIEISRNTSSFEKHYDKFEFRFKARYFRPKMEVHIRTSDLSDEPAFLLWVDELGIDEFTSVLEVEDAIFIERFQQYLIDNFSHVRTQNRDSERSEEEIKRFKEAEESYKSVKEKK